MAARNNQSLRKQQQIISTNKTMFLWVAGASAVVAMAAVVGLFLTQRLIFNERVLAAKSETLSNLQHNNSVAEQLKENVRVRNTDERLGKLRVNDSDEPLQVVIDSLPSTPNSAALGASLQSNKLLSADGISVESLTVTPIAGSEADSETAVETPSGQNAIQFEFQVSTRRGNANALKAVLARLERSIRVINVTTLTVETQGNQLVMTGEGEGYFEPARTLDLKEKSIKP